MANFDREFFGLVFPGLQATQKIHAQTSRPELSAFLSNFTFLNPKFIHGDFLLTGETQKLVSSAEIMLVTNADLSRAEKFTKGSVDFGWTIWGAQFLSEPSLNPFKHQSSSGEVGILGPLILQIEHLYLLRSGVAPVQLADPNSSRWTSLGQTGPFGPCWSEIWFGMNKFVQNGPGGLDLVGPFGPAHLLAVPQLLLIRPISFISWSEPILSNSQNYRPENY